MQGEQLRGLLPWRQPFLMIDRMLACEPHRSIVTVKNVTTNDSVTGSEGGGQDCFPSVLLLEGMSQSAALLYRLSYEDCVDRLPMLGFLKAKLSERPVVPGDALTYSVRSVKMTRTGGVFEGEAAVDQEVVARAQLAFAASSDSAAAGEVSA